MDIDKESQRLYFEYIPKELILLIIDKLESLIDVKAMIDLIYLDINDTMSLIKYKSPIMAEMLSKHRKLFDRLMPKDEYDIHYLRLYYCLILLKLTSSDIDSNIKPLQWNISFFQTTSRIDKNLRQTVYYENVDTGIGSSIYIIFIIMYINILYKWNQYFFKKLIVLLDKILSTDKLIL